MRPCACKRCAIRARAGGLSGLSCPWGQGRRPCCGRRGFGGRLLWVAWVVPSGPALTAHRDAPLLCQACEAALQGAALMGAPPLLQEGVAADPGGACVVNQHCELVQLLGKGGAGHGRVPCVTNSNRDSILSRKQFTRQNSVSKEVGASWRGASPCQAPCFSSHPFGMDFLCLL